MKENEEEGFEAGAEEITVAEGEGCGDATAGLDMKPKADEAEGADSGAGSEEMKPKAEDGESFLD
jgi:hypothetical protein